jgi:hypothetical protein
MSSEIIQNVAYDNYDDFQHVNFTFSQNFISLFWGLFNDKTDLRVRYHFPLCYGPYGQESLSCHCGGALFLWTNPKSYTYICLSGWNWPPKGGGVKFLPIGVQCTQLVGLPITNEITSRPGLSWEERGHWLDTHIYIMLSICDFAKKIFLKSKFS